MEYSDLITKLVTDVKSKKIKSYQLEEIISKELPMETAAELARQVRLKVVEETLNIDLPYLKKQTIPSYLTNANIELLTGFTQIPLAFVGIDFGGIPIKAMYSSKVSEIDSSERMNAIIPIATTEGNLVAGLNNAAKIMKKSGITKVDVEYVGMTRAPLLKTDSTSDSEFIVEWINKNKERIIEHINSSGISKHVKLKDIDTERALQGLAVHPRFVYDAADSMGMNAVTKLSDVAVRYILSEIKKEKPEINIRYLSVSGNMCTDKKATEINWTKGRGYKVRASIFIPKNILDEKEISPEMVVELNLEKNIRGSEAAGTIGGFNAHIANQLAGLYIATGQDPAQIAEGHMGKTEARIISEDEKEGLEISIFMPAVEVGTVGGGTRLPTQKEALRVLGIEGGGEPVGINAFRLAAITALTALAGELNVLIALGTGKLADEHEKIRQRSKN